MPRPGCKGTFGEPIRFLSQSADSQLKHVIYHNTSVDHHGILPASFARLIFNAFIYCTLDNYCEQLVAPWL